MKKLKLFIVILMLFVYTSIGMFGLFEFDHITGTAMLNCPYVQNKSSVCANSLEHIDNWRQFSNIVVPSLLVFSLLILGMVLYFFGNKILLNKKRYYYSLKYYLENNQLSVYLGNIIWWLSLFENSPSFIGSRI